MNASREAFDLFHPACRKHFYSRLKRGFRFVPWSLVLSDTWNRVCSKPQTKGAQGNE